MGFKSALEKQKPHGTATYTFDTITLNSDKSPIFEVRHAGPSNPRYQSELVKAANERPNAGGKLTEKKLHQGDLLDARLFARGSVVVSWQHVHEDDGAPAPCTPDKVEELLVEFIENRRDLWLNFREFCKNAENFRDGELTVGAELGKK